ncbi:MAG: purple acid phosphatase family protein [Planctomycetota bacterium]|jgi:hypothetical protein
MLVSWILWFFLAQVPDFHEHFTFGYSHEWRISDPAEAEGGPSHWFVKDGILHQSAATMGSASRQGAFPGPCFYLLEPSFEDGLYLARISSQDCGGIGLLFRMQSAETCYRLLFYLNEAKGKPLARIEKIEGQAITVLAVTREPLSCPFGPWWVVAIKMEGSRFEVLLNGEVLLEAADDSFGKGGLGITCWSNEGVRVDSLAFFQEAVSEETLKPKPALLKGPVLGCLTPTGFELAWETSRPYPAQVEIVEGMESRTIDVDEGALFHEAEITGLKPGMMYGYRILSGPIQSPLYKIKTPAEGIEKFSFCIYGDNRSNPDVHRFVVRSLVRKTPDFVLNVGNLVDHGLRYEEWHPQFFDPADWLIHTMPFYVSPGDHEESSPWFDTFFTRPGNERYYAFTHGTAFFIALDTNQDVTAGSAQHAWLKEALASKEAEAARWRFAFFHHPPYSEGNASYEGATAIREAILPLFEAADFDILFFGHVTDYERGKLNGVYHVVTGGGGAPLCLGKHYKAREVAHIEVYRSVHHACLVEIDGNEMRFQAFTPDGIEFDAFQITK